MNKELEKRCRETLVELTEVVIVFKEIKKELKENEKTNEQKVYDTFSVMPKSFPNNNNG